MVCTHPLLYSKRGNIKPYILGNLSIVDEKSDSADWLKENVGLGNQPTSFADTSEIKRHIEMSPSPNKSAPISTGPRSNSAPSASARLTSPFPPGKRSNQTTVAYQNTDGSFLIVLVSLNFNVASGLLTATSTRSTQYHPRCGPPAAWRSFYIWHADTASLPTRWAAATPD